MGKIVPQFGVIETVLASAVTNGNTFTVGYPTGFSQASFQNGLDAGNAVMIVSGNDRYSGAQVGVSFGASLITITNSTTTTLAAGSRIKLQFNQKSGNDLQILEFPINLATITGTQDVVTDYQPGFAGSIESVQFVVNQPVTTAAKLVSLNVEINTTDVTGGVVALTSALATPMGKVIAGSAVTALNSFGAADKISVEASAVTAFSEGSGTLLIAVRKAANNYY